MKLLSKIKKLFKKEVKPTPKGDCKVTAKAMEFQKLCYEFSDAVESLSKPVTDKKLIEELTKTSQDLILLGYQVISLIDTVMSKYTHPFKVNAYKDNTEKLISMVKRLNNQLV